MEGTPQSFDLFIEQEHPGKRPMEPEDPLEMAAEPVDGDPLVMLDCLVEEYARMGLPGDEILGLFDRPFFQATHGLKRLLGEGVVRKRVRETLDRCGVLRVRTIVAGDPAVLDIEQA